MHQWQDGSRVGVRVQPGSATAALVIDGRPIRQSSARFDGSGDSAIAGLLRTVISTAAVESVAWELSELLVPALESAPVATLRIAPRRPVSAALSSHPAPLVRSLACREAVVHGGHDLFGTELAPLDVTSAVREARASFQEGFEVLAVTASGAAGCADHEMTVAEAVLDAVPGLRLCLSHEVGGFGLLLREAATVLNAALHSRAVELVSRCERVTSAASPHAAAWFATGDGGRVSAERMRTFPVSVLGARGAASLVGAAMLAGTSTATVVLADNGSLVSGQVRDRLAHVASDVMETADLRLATPQAVLSPLSAAVSPGTPEVTVVAAVDETDAEIARGFAGLLESRRLVEPGWDLVATGATATEPGAWLDLVVSADSAGELRRVRTLLEQRACTLVASGGALPGSERVVSSTAIPLSFLRSGSYRLMVRAGGRSGAER